MWIFWTRIYVSRHALVPSNLLFNVPFHSSRCISISKPSSIPHNLSFLIFCFCGHSLPQKCLVSFVAGGSIFCFVYWIVAIVSFLLFWNVFLLLILLDLVLMSSESLFFSQYFLVYFFQLYCLSSLLLFFPLSHSIISLRFLLSFIHCWHVFMVSSVVLLISHLAFVSLFLVGQLSGFHWGLHIGVRPYWNEFFK